MIQARLIRNKGGAALLESLDGEERRSVPSHTITFNGDNLVVLPDNEWQRGAKQNFAFTDVTIDAQTVKTYFHRRGLHSSADIVTHRAEARAALNDALGELITRLLTQEEDE